MNTFVKGSIAAGVGLVLLMGGAGTFALWNSSASVADTAISSGTMTLAAGTGSWNANTAKWVPGDSFTYTTHLTVTAVGDNLKSTLSLTPGSLSGGTDLPGALTVAMAVTPPAGVTVNATNPAVWEVTPKTSGTYDIPVVVTVTFKSTTGGTTAQNETVDLTGISFTLQQHV